MKTFFIITIIFLESLNAGISSQLIKSAAGFFEKEGVHTGATIAKVSVIYGDDTAKFLVGVQKQYGRQGIEILKHYGNKSVVASSNAFQLVRKYGDKGFYMLQRCPNAPVLFGKYGKNYIEMGEKYGVKRVSKWIEEAEVKGKGAAVLKYLEKFGSKAVVFYEKNWGKLLITGFAALNADNIIGAAKESVNYSLDTGKSIAVEGSMGLLKTVLDSPMGYVLMFAIMAYLLLLIWLKWKRFMHEEKEYRYNKIRAK